MVQKLFWLIILRVCTALTEELLFMKAKAKNTSASAEAVELTSPIGRPTLIGAPIAGGAAEAVEAGDGRRRTEDKEESFQGNKVPHSEDSIAHVLFFCVCLFVCVFFLSFFSAKKNRLSFSSSSSSSSVFRFLPLV